MSKHQNPRQKPKAKIRVMDLEATARRLYLEEGGNELDETIETQQLTQGAYRSQMKAFKRLAEQGILWDGEGLPPGAWGPVVSPREARLCGDQVRKLLKQKEEWIERCREKVRQKMEEDAEDQAEPEDQEQTPPPIDPPTEPEAITETEAAIHAPPEERRSA